MTHLVAIRELTVLPPWALLLVLFALPALEASSLLGLVIPGEIVVLLGGVLAHEGRVALTAVMLAAVLGAVAGDSIGYLLGARLGQRLFTGAPDSVGRHLDRARAFVRRYGALAVMLGRWAAVLRALVPSIAGASGMQYRRFLAYNVAGGVSWGITIAVIGYLAEAAYGLAERLLGLTGALLALVIVVLALVEMRRANRGRPVR